MPDQIDQALLDEIQRPDGSAQNYDGRHLRDVQYDSSQSTEAHRRLATLGCDGTGLPKLGHFDHYVVHRHARSRGHVATPSGKRFNGSLAGFVKIHARSLQIAEENQVTLGVEPEVANVINSARKARQLLDELRSPHLKIVMDGANLFHRNNVVRMREILDEAFELLGQDIVIAHAKDLNQDGEAGTVPAGKGVLDYDHYIRLLRETHFQGPLILHSLTEAQVSDSIAFLESKLKNME